MTELLSLSRMSVRWFLLVLAIFALIGCGGKGSKTTSAAPFVSLQWPARSKTTTPTLDGLSSAVSVNVTVTSKVNGDVSVANADRPTDPTAVLIGYTLNKKLIVGAVHLVVTLYSQTGEKGVAVGSIATDAFLGGAGVLFGADNNPIGNLQVLGVVASVQITVPGTTGAQTTASVGVGQTLQFGFTCEDANNNLLAISSSQDAGAAIFQAQTASIATCTPTGLATGVKAGTTQIGCLVDGKTAQLTLTVNPAPIAPVITVGWGALTRGNTPLTSARSVAVSVTDGTTISTVNADRLSFASNPASYTQNLTGNNKLLVGNVTITVTFYDKVGEAGDVVGTFNATGSMTSAGALLNHSGSSLGTVDSNAVITRVVIDPPNPVAVGGTEQLTFKCFDSNNNLIANVDPGSGSFTTSGSVLTVSPSGVVTGVNAGNQNVTCTVDGVASAATQVTVTPGPTKPIVYIGFGAISRAGGALTSARSVKVQVTDGTNTATAMVDREAYNQNNGAAYTNLMSFDQGITVGAITITCTWYAATGETGQVVGNFSASGTMTNAGVLKNQSGTPFGDTSSDAINGNPVITTVVIQGQPITIVHGSPTQLTFKCFDTNNVQITVDPGSGTWTTSGSVLTITPSGIATGNTTGSSQNVTCTVDGVAGTASVKVS